MIYYPNGCLPASLGGVAEVTFYIQNGVHYGWGIPSEIYSWTDDVVSGSLVMRFRIRAICSLPTCTGQNYFPNLSLYWPSKVLLLIHILGCTSKTSPFAQSTLQLSLAVENALTPWGVQTPEVEIKHEKKPSDNRKMITTVTLRLNGNVLKTGSAELPRPGYDPNSA
jgi:hypothetical protein